MISRAQATKEKTDKVDYIKIKNFCASKITTRRVKRQPRKWEKILSNQISDQGLIFKI